MHYLTKAKFINVQNGYLNHLSEFKNIGFCNWSMNVNLLVESDDWNQ